MGVRQPERLDVHMPHWGLSASRAPTRIEVLIQDCLWRTNLKETGTGRRTIDTRRTDQLFGIYVFVMHGAVFVRRLSARTDGTILVSSNNKNYPPEEVLMSSVRWGEPDSTDTMCIIGRIAMLMTTAL